VVLLTSGYNNVSPGDGKGYLYILDVATGEVLQRVGTGEGSTTTPSGLGRIAAWADNFNLDNTAKYVYAGDLRGHVWRFDLTGTTATVEPLGTLTDASNRPQSVTTKPELANVNGHRVVYIGTGRFLGLSDLQDPATWVPSSTDAYQQSLYAIKDSGINHGNVRSSGTLVQQTLAAKDTLGRTVTTNTVDWSSNNGWYVDFNPGGTSPGERVNVDPQLTLGTLNVKTNVPNARACTFGGDSWYYQFRYDTGSFISTAPGQLVAQKLTNVLIVGSTIVGTGAGLRDIIIDNTGRAQVVGVNVGATGSSGKRIGWREITK
jgi:type IV pilus assembly protein PilY1